MCPLNVISRLSKSRDSGGSPAIAFRYAGSDHTPWICSRHPRAFRALDRPADRSRDGANGGGARFLVFRARAAIARVKLRKIDVSLPVFLHTRREDTTSVANASGNDALRRVVGPNTRCGNGVVKPNIWFNFPQVGDN